METIKEKLQYGFEVASQKKIKSILDDCNHELFPICASILEGYEGEAFLIQETNALLRASMTVCDETSKSMIGRLDYISVCIKKVISLIPESDENKDVKSRLESIYDLAQQHLNETNMEKIQNYVNFYLNPILQKMIIPLLNLLPGKSRA